MFIWMPGWRQLAVPLATHLLVVIVLFRHSLSVWSVVLSSLWLISLLSTMHRCWPRIGSAIHIALPDSPIPDGAPLYPRMDPVVHQVVRVVWSLPRWVSVELATEAGREVVDIFSSEMAAHELAMLRRWTQRDKLLHRFSRRRAAGRPADP